MPAATAALPNGNGTAVNGHGDAKKSAAKSRGALKRLKAKAKAARAGTESEAETDKESDTEVCSADTMADASSLLGLVGRIVRIRSFDYRFDDSRPLGSKLRGLRLHLQPFQRDRRRRKWR